MLKVFCNLSDSMINKSRMGMCLLISVLYLCLSGVVRESLLLLYDCLFQSYSIKKFYLSSFPGIPFWLNQVLQLLVILTVTKQVFLSSTALPVGALISLISGSNRHTVRHLIISMSIMNSNLDLYPLDFVHPAVDFTWHYFLISLALFGQSRMN